MQVAAHAIRGCIAAARTGASAARTGSAVRESRGRSARRWLRARQRSAGYRCQDRARLSRSGAERSAAGLMLPHAVRCLRCDATCRRGASCRRRRGPDGFPGALWPGTATCLPTRSRAGIPTWEPQRHLYGLVKDFIDRSGKGLRPALCIATARALGGRDGGCVSRRRRPRNAAQRLSRARRH